jgi:hypothetical protein
MRPNDGITSRAGLPQAIFDPKPKFANRAASPPGDKPGLRSCGGWRYVEDTSILAMDNRTYDS